jgi:hypothetical protein
MDDARAALRMLDGRVGPGGKTLHVGLLRPPAVHANQMWRWVYHVEDMEKNDGAMVVRKEKRGSRISGEGLGLGLGRVRKNKMILRVLNIERVEAASTCSSWSEARWVEVPGPWWHINTPSQFGISYLAWLRTHVVGCMTLV